MSLNLTQPLKFLIPGQEIEILCRSFCMLMVIYHLPFFEGVEGGWTEEKRGPSVDHRWSAGPGFTMQKRGHVSGWLESTVLQNHLKVCLPFIRGTVSLPTGSLNR